jgi:hypothetical protein
MENGMNYAVRQWECSSRRILFAVGVILLTFGHALTGNPKASIAGLVILMLSVLL